MYRYLLSLLTTLLIWAVFMPTGDGFVSLVIIGAIVFPLIEWLHRRYFPRVRISTQQELDIETSGIDISSGGDSGGDGD
jgi:hypothetical protein